MISIISPAYKVQKYINDFLESFAPLNGKVPYEIIIVNDEPNFDYKNIINKNILKTINIKFIKNKKNIGLGDSRNVGLKNISKNTTHILFVDTDDRINANCLIDAYKLLSSKPIIFAHNRWYSNKKVYQSPNGDISNQSLPNYLWGILFPIEIGKQAIAQSNEQNDFPIIYRLANKYEFIKSNEALVDYRIRKSSITWKNYNSNKVIKIITSFENLNKERLINTEKSNKLIWEELLIFKKSFEKKQYKELISKYKEKRKRTWSFNGIIYRIVKWWKLKEFVSNLILIRKRFK